ncbi:hypothetical protein [Volucribacter amazonae]|uniref:Uncharacterized protein n=1 Tax=Volucribacter amazonae TaxID=256731 RepID=A0A9X4SHD6_9PAST|nr:hypothetical protein [Volucribacter amazonae]MDG6894345.1 hypothetical protein [Volucribacter amazonae]
MKTLGIQSIIFENPFINKLYGSEPITEVAIPQIYLDEYDHGLSHIYIHIKKKPLYFIPKYGTWGVDYNVIILHLIGKIDDIEIKNLGIGTDFSTVNIQHIKDDKYFLSKETELASLKMVLSPCILQKTERYKL